MASSSHQLIVILSGAPGSGKSTLADALVRASAASAAPLERVCQDIIKAGKRGTRQMCLANMARALDLGKGVVIDRTGAMKEQREPFIAAAKGRGTRVLGVFLDIAAPILKRRIMAREQTHESGVQGSKGIAISERFRKQLASDPPRVSEGFDRIEVFRGEPALETMVCRILGSAESHPGPARHAQAPRNAFDVLMARSRAPPTETAPGPSRPAACKSSYPVLRRLVERICPADRSCALVDDKYPKARHHAIVIARDPALVGPTSLRPVPFEAHLAILGDMRREAEAWIETKQRGEGDGEGEGVRFRLGFHAIPSLPQLHLHVISTDFESPWMRTKKHWNSFNVRANFPTALPDSSKAPPSSKASKALQPALTPSAHPPIRSSARPFLVSLVVRTPPADCILPSTGQGGVDAGAWECVAMRCGCVRGHAQVKRVRGDRRHAQAESRFGAKTEGARRADLARQPFHNQGITV